MLVRKMAVVAFSALAALPLACGHERAANRGQMTPASGTRPNPPQSSPETTAGGAGGSSTNIYAPLDLNEGTTGTDHNGMDGNGFDRGSSTTDMRAGSGSASARR
jgi:hypothetical protein